MRHVGEDEVGREMREMEKVEDLLLSDPASERGQRGEANVHAPQPPDSVQVPMPSVASEPDACVEVSVTPIVDVPLASLTLLDAVWWWESGSIEVNCYSFMLSAEPRVLLWQ